MGTISKIKVISLCLFFSSSVFAQDVQEIDDTYFFTTDREIPKSIANDARLKPVVETENTLASKYTNPDFNGETSLENESFDYYSETPINDQYVFGTNTIQNNYGYGFNNSWGWGANPYSRFNDPFFNPYHPYASNWGMGFNSWGTGFGMMYSPWGTGFSIGFNRGFGWGYGNGFYDPFFDPYMYSYNSFAFRNGFGWGMNRFYRPNTIVVVESPIRTVTPRYSRGNMSTYSRSASNRNRMASYKPSSDGNRVASSRVRNVDQLQQRVSDRNNGRLKSTTSTSNAPRNYNRSSSYSSGRNAYNSGSRNYNSGRNSYSSGSRNYNTGRSSYNTGRSNSYRRSSSSYSSPSRSRSSSYRSSSSGGSRSSSVRRGRQ